MAFPVLFDTCALYPIGLADLLLRLGDKRAFRPLWSRDILLELEQNLLDNVPLTPTQVNRRISAMREHFPDAEVRDYEGLVEAMRCDEKDRHVLAAAVRSNAELIVTFNIRDFPVIALKPYEIEAMHPDDFLLDQLDLYSGLTLEALEEQAAAYRDPAMAADDLLDLLERTGLPRFAAEVRERR